MSSSSSFNPEEIKVIQKAMTEGMDSLTSKEREILKNSTKGDFIKNLSQPYSKKDGSMRINSYRSPGSICAGGGGDGGGDGVCICVGIVILIIVVILLLKFVFHVF